MVDKKIIPSYPSQSGQAADLLMREMSALIFPVNCLGGRDRKRLKPFLLNERRDEKSHAVKEEVHLPVMMKIKRGGPVLDILYD